MTLPHRLDIVFKGRLAVSGLTVTCVVAVSAVRADRCAVIFEVGSRVLELVDADSVINAG